MKNYYSILIIWLLYLQCAGCTPSDNCIHTSTTEDIDKSNYINNAPFYFTQENDTIITYESLQQKYEYYISQANRSKTNGNLIEVLQHLEKAHQTYDSIQKLFKTETINLEEYQQMKNENNRLKHQHQWLLTAGILLLPLLIIIPVYIHKKKRKRADVPVYPTTDAEMTEQQHLRTNAFMCSDLYHQILQASKDDSINISPIGRPAIWISLKENLDILYPGFTTRLLEKCPNLSETEQQICWLSKLNIQPSGIARILKLSRQAISNSRSRIIKKNIHEEGDSTNFVHFIEKI